MNAYLLLALASALAGCSSIYLASPNQRWRSTPWRAGPARATGAGLLVVCLIAFGQVMQATTAAFVFLTLLMLAFTLLPYAGALISLRRRS
ncbi:hypothetical protein IAI53_03390 [Thauera sp. CAU 1555]|uniref:Lipoprotein n=1 Tax=Thauera sedimentorum TaxID=2767595 RepID=A0ABR9B6B9_9RHOO|nr:hypothetical protein [Thauera sedimentorum]MBC9070998.1 hypothetical protein [Thauera sedimentorum]MBD8501917.1 hypothetical protein [Thauera sedimentorum]